MPVVRPKNAASLMIYRQHRNGVEVFMGQRHARARFKPGVFVFPGGMVERSDYRVVTATPLNPDIVKHLAVAGSTNRATALALAAVRETFEETALVLAHSTQLSNTGNSTNPTWQIFRGQGLAPALANLFYLGRAITPAVQPIRFHARFFCVDAKHLSGTPKSNGELEALQWVKLNSASALPMMSVTKVMLEALQAHLAGQKSAPLVLAFRGHTPINFSD